ncbi:MAG: type II secretion system F family protein [Candidatus Thermoplasmatota archaeon]|nr:type II secretion system F family protein [Candidatus Thermoplasmatota archaeon]
MEGEAPPKKTARKQIIGRRNAGPSYKEIKTSADPEKTVKITIYSISIILGITFLLLGILTMPFGPLSKVKEEYENEYQYMNDDETRLYMKEGPLDFNLTFNTTGKWIKDEVKIEFHSFLMLAVVFGFGPTSFYEVRKRKKIDKIESRLSDFLRDVSESMRAGQTLHEAIKTSAGGEYGALTGEIEKMALQVSWGVSASKAMEMFSERVNTPLVKRAVTLINEASSAGGNVSNVIDAAAKDTRELQIMKSIRYTEMSMYTYVIGISFLVFLVVIAVMFATFMPRMVELSESYSTGDSGSSQAPGGFDPTSVDFGLMKYLFFSAAAIQAVGDGVIGGLMSSGRLSKGFQMASVFALFTWLIFDFVLL